MVKTMVSCKFSLKPIHWVFHHIPGCMVDPESGRWTLQDVVRRWDVPQGHGLTKPGKVSLKCSKYQATLEHNGKGYWRENDAHKIIYIYILYTHSRVVQCLEYDTPRTRTSYLCLPSSTSMIDPVREILRMFVWLIAKCLGLPLKTPDVLIWLD